MDIPKDRTLINDGHYYMVGRSLKTDKRYECDICGYRGIELSLNKCPGCGKKIIWIKGGLR